MPRSLLVTGAAGFIGANFVHYWMAQHPAGRWAQALIGTATF